MKHAFVILAHDKFSTLEHLLRLLDDSRNRIYLHVDAKAADFEEARFQAVLREASLHLVPRIPVHWAGRSQIDAVLVALEHALKDDFDYFHLLTGADLPIKSPSEIDEFFERNVGDEFIDFAPENYNFATYKAAYLHFFTNNRYYRTKRSVKYLNHGLAKIQQHLRMRRTRSRRFYHGSAYFSISREFAEYVHTKACEIRADYKWTLAADEVFIQTLIMESPFRERVHTFEEKHFGNARWIDRDRGRGNSPYTFRIEDLQALLSAPAGLLFARKFDEDVDSAIISEIEDHLKRKGLSSNKERKPA